MRMTVKQYIAAVKRCSAAPADMRYQTEAWPYPQANQSHIAFWRADWLPVHVAGVPMMPVRQIRVPVVGSDYPGVLMTVADDAPRPSEVAAALAVVETGES